LSTKYHPACSELHGEGSAGLALSIPPEGHAGVGMPEGAVHPNPDAGIRGIKRITTIVNINLFFHSILSPLQFLGLVIKLCTPICNFGTCTKI
jgi:hypothetical protein